MRPLLKGKLMMLIAIIAAVVIGFICGIAAERKVNTLKLVALKEAHKAELRKAHSEGWDTGWQQASTSAINVKDRYEEIFGTKK